MSTIHLCFRSCFSEACDSEPTHRHRSVEGATATLDMLKLDSLPVMLLHHLALSEFNDTLILLSLHSTNSATDTISETSAMRAPNK
eukprot:scaffold12702_cov119-Skeletonema_dohrnii-CCMP3373.AAC.5